jgi:hypothetical protein
MEPEGSLPCSQEPATGTHPEPDESSPHPDSLFLTMHFIASGYLRLGLPNALFRSGFPTRI